MKTQILIEGTDCSGKTTLVERIKNELRWDAKALHHREEEQFRRYLREYALSEQVVFNRGHFSEIVYGRLWRGGNPFSAEQQSILDAICRQKMLLIFACPPLEILQQRYCERKFPQQIKYDELMALEGYFREQMEKVPHLCYRSTSYDELDSLLQQIRREVQ